MRFKTGTTTDLYFLHSCANMVKGRWTGARPVIRLGNNSFQCGQNLLVIRRDNSEVLARIFQRVREENCRLIYLIDDNIWQASDDDSLPAPYRASIEQMYQSVAQPLIEAASRVFVSSRLLLPFVSPDKKPEVVRPAWPMEPPIGDHFRYADDYFSLVHMGTNSHQAGFDFIIPVVDAVIKRFPHLHFTYHSNADLLGALDQHPRVLRKPTLRWSFYRRQLSRAKHHLGLYPITDTPLNQGRSINKILEHPLAGCSALYSDAWEQKSVIEQYGGGLCLPNQTEVWIEQIAALVEDSEKARQLYHRAMHAFYQLNTLTAQRDFWKANFINQF